MTKADYYYNSSKGRTISDSPEKVADQLDMKNNIDLEKMIWKVYTKSNVRSPIAYLTIIIDTNLACF